MLKEPPLITAAASRPADAAVKAARSILALLFGPPSQRPFAVRYWNGLVDAPTAERVPAFTLVLRRPGALRRMLLPPSEPALGEAYLRDDFDVEGDFEAAAGLSDLVMGRLRSAATVARLLPQLLALPRDEPSPGESPRPRSVGALAGRARSRGRDAAAVRFHYDISNDFYRLWLDTRMIYSCAYFETGTEDLDTAQAAKLEYICRKLRLRPGERLLDIGCGWGGLVQHAVEHHGVQAVGITLSMPQAALARERIGAAGLSDHCRIEVCDYRDVPRGASFDKVVSVGMFEQVGEGELPTYFNKAFALTRPGGLFLNHGIVRTAPLGWLRRRLWQDTTFIHRYVFPDGELISPAGVTRISEAAGFELRDLESLREHYARTLRHWVQRLEAHHAEAVAVAGEPAYRVWRLYMAAAARAFVTGGISIVQLLLSRPTPDGACYLPPTRKDLYCGPLTH